MKTLKAYRIARHYRSVLVWEISPMTKACVCTHTFIPDKKLTREERHAEIAALLFKDFDIPGPSYREK